MRVVRAVVMVVMMVVVVIVLGGIGGVSLLVVGASTCLGQPQPHRRSTHREAAFLRHNRSDRSAWGRRGSEMAGWRELAVRERMCGWRGNH